MTTSVSIYNKIKTAILLNPNVKSFGLWNNQVNKDKAGNLNPIKYPFIGIQFENNYDQLSYGDQQIDGTFVLFICIQSLSHSDEDILNFKDSVFGSLIAQLPKQGFSNFSRVYEVQDTDRDNILVWQQEYSYSYIDDTGRDNHTTLSGWTFTTATSIDYTGYTTTNLQASM